MSQVLVTSDHARDARSRRQWGEVLQSALLRILDLAKTAGGSGTVSDTATSVHEHNDVGLLLAVAVFMLHAPPGVAVCDATADDVKYPAVNAFVRAFQRQDQTHTRRRCIVQTAASIFQLADRRLAVPFVQAMAPPILRFVIY